MNALQRDSKRDYTEQFHILVRMHLSFVLDLNTDDNECFTDKGRMKKWALVPFGKKSKSRGVMEGAPLTQEGICQVYQLIEFLKKRTKRTGSLERQQELRSLLNQGVTLQLEGGTYNVHDCASVLKGFLAELPDPLLTEAHFPVYCQIAELCGIIRQPTQEGKLLEALQLLLLLLPTENKVLLKDILDLLHLTASFESHNRMSPDNLAKLFTPHLLCPRKLSPENLLKDSQTLFGIVSFMIKNSAELFKIPIKLIVDFRAKYEKKNILSPTKRLNESVTDAASTVFTFVDHERTAKENESNPTETALAQLYAHIQSLPESSKRENYTDVSNEEHQAKRLKKSTLSTENIAIESNEITKDCKRSQSEPDLSINEGEKACNMYLTSTPACFPLRACPDIIFTPEDQDRKSMSPITRSTQRMSRAMQETMMTPRSRKPVLVLSGTNIHTLHKNEQPNCVMDNLTEELSECSSEEGSPESEHPIKKSKSDGDIIKEPKTQKVQKLNRTDTPISLTDTFREYLSSRNIETLSSPVDLSFSSRTDDFNSTDFKDLSDSKLTDSLLYCLNGNDPDDVKMMDENSEGKALVLKPKQFDENGKPIVFETSF
ncbi:hypothetical protein NQ314_005785 [Rhamnusium bicolor]|uniref:Rho-GAP domain-containing protein n=1 Tax=Rhamnusium bicolor TaxID=1586634 RepID=A0AAV8ZEN6_9CUCU|nr:hypothetical protein NQ314_005785 [Rhamnusium bicolor]